MIIVMKPGAPRKDTRTVIEKIRELGYTPHTIYGKTRNVIGAIGDERGKFVLHSLESLPGVERVVPILKPYKLASREGKPEPTEIRLAPGVSVGGKRLLVIAGPRSVEGEPPMDVDLVARYSDILQVGARNVQNFSLLKRIGKAKRPILLKRGMMTTINEFLMSAEYCLSSGSRHVILCERGIRTFEDATRNTLDLSAVPVLKERTHLPVFVDPSHGTGHSQYVKPMSCASVAAGADGLMIEVHPTPEKALSDGPQSLTFEKFEELMAVLKPFVAAAGRTI